MEPLDFWWVQRGLRVPLSLAFIFSLTGAEMLKDIFTAVVDDVVKRILGVFGVLVLLVGCWVPLVSPMLKNGPKNVQEAYASWFIFLALSVILVFKPHDDDEEEEELEYWGRIHRD